MRLIAGPAHAVRTAEPALAAHLVDVAGDTLVCVSIDDMGRVLPQPIARISEAFRLRADLQRTLERRIVLRVV